MAVYTTGGLTLNPGRICFEFRASIFGFSAERVTRESYPRAIGEVTNGRGYSSIALRPEVFLFLCDSGHGRFQKPFPG